MFFKPSYISIYLLSLNVCAYVCVCICPPLKIENARLRPFAGHVPSTRQAPMPATGKAPPISERSGHAAGRQPDETQQADLDPGKVARLPACKVAGRREGQAGERRGCREGGRVGRTFTGTARASRRPGRPDLAPVRPIASLASPCQRPVGRSNRASLACWGLNLGNGRFNPPPCEAGKPPESFIMAAPPKIFATPPARSRLGPPMLPPAPARAFRGSPPPENCIFEKMKSPYCAKC